MSNQTLHILRLTPFLFFFLLYTLRTIPLPPPALVVNPPHATPVATVPLVLIALKTPCE